MAVKPPPTTGDPRSCTRKQLLSTPQVHTLQAISVKLTDMQVESLSAQPGALADCSHTAFAKIALLFRAC